MRHILTMVSGILVLTLSWSPMSTLIGKRPDDWQQYADYVLLTECLPALIAGMSVLGFGLRFGNKVQIFASLLAPFVTFGALNAAWNFIQ